MGLILFSRTVWVGIFAFLQIALVGLVDFLTGYELGFFIFYFLPVGYAAWQAGRLGGSGASVLSAFSWWLARDLAGQHPALFSPLELWNVGIRLIAFLLFAFVFARVRELLDLERELAGRLQATLDQVQELHGLLPICAACKRIRDDKGYWQQIENYISTHSRAEFTHGICPECAQRLYPDHYRKGEHERKGGEGGRPTEERAERPAPRA
jgi:hypothetical protein